MRCVILFVMAATLCSCTYKVPNVEVCKELTRGDAFCVRAIGNKERHISASDWVVERKTRLSVDVKGYAEMLKFVEIVCNETQRCVENLDQRVQSFHQKMGIIKK